MCKILSQWLAQSKRTMPRVSQYWWWWLEEVRSGVGVGVGTSHTLELADLPPDTGSVTHSLCQTLIKLPFLNLSFPICKMVLMITHNT